MPGSRTSTHRFRGANREPTTHDDFAQVMRRTTDRSVQPIAPGWSSAPAPRRPGRIRRHLPAFLLMIPLVVGLIGAPAGTPVAHGDELSDARDRQEQLKKEVANQKE